MRLNQEQKDQVQRVIEKSIPIPVEMFQIEFVENDDGDLVEIGLDYANGNTFACISYIEGPKAGVLFTWGGKSTKQRHNFKKTCEPIHQNTTKLLKELGVL